MAFIFTVYQERSKTISYRTQKEFNTKELRRNSVLPVDSVKKILDSNENTPRKKKLKEMIKETLEQWTTFAKPSPSNLWEISQSFLKDCGYNIHENNDDIEDMWEPQFPSNEFHLYWAVMQFIEHKLKNISNSYITIKEQLVVAGFNITTAAHIEECCLRNEVYDWEPLIYWINVYFEVKLRQLSPTPSQEEYHKKFLNGDWQKNEWYEEEIEVVRSKTKKSLDVKVIYVSRTDQIPDLIIDGEAINLGIRNGNIWYHGTSAKNLPSLRDDGILLGKGNLNLDFSRSGGFYLSRDIEMAKQWAAGRDGKNDTQSKKSKQKKKKGGEANPHFEGYDVVFIYQFDRSEYIGVDLSQNRQEWEDTVNYYRNGVSIELTNQELGIRLYQAEYIYGAMSGGGSKEGRLTQKDANQLCIAQLSMSTPVTYNLKGIVYITPEEQSQKK